MYQCWRRQVSVSFLRLYLTRSASRTIQPKLVPHYRLPISYGTAIWTNSELFFFFLDSTRAILFLKHDFSHETSPKAPQGVLVPCPMNQTNSSILGFVCYSWLENGMNCLSQHVLLPWSPFLVLGTVKSMASSKKSGVEDRIKHIATGKKGLFHFYLLYFY